ncbi:uncharacterized protein Z518_04469 [Rhinocladiella mackenziei CBS 650.93]|uniref:Zn(2)-C6 fungal-type domain-containing protein n=1 Tax=Rhinocladiella mackenziei CBS 650.93 TaxID=1442369 RepID=A0A0D2H7W3_9EURO|nr:uncharacterized protein Z518_04469 [Rhinocladiella mackenziei CBS 650.93]KIX06493.1 hypothetical protein Z518_04469 [Rhinocladiella mackenziei CBS 650.93]
MGTRIASCGRCRAKKLKCDRRPTTCTSCSRAGVACLLPNPPPRLVWLNPEFGPRLDGEDPRQSTKREALYTSRFFSPGSTSLTFSLSYSVRERALECSRLQSWVNHQGIDSLLDQIDVQSRALNADKSATIGFFGAFSIQQARNKPPEHELETPSFSNVTETECFDSHELFGEAENSNLDDDDVASLQECLQRSPSRNAAVSQSKHGVVSGACILPQRSDFDIMPLLASPTAFVVSAVYAQDLADLDPITSKTLLDHYTGTLVSRLSPAQIQSKSPWKTLHIPSVLQTLGEVMLTGTGSNARVALMFAIFATTAFNLHHLGLSQDSSSTAWHSMGEIYRQRAKVRLKACLRSFSPTYKKEKNKEVLMALLSMVTICVVSGDMKEARAYLLDVENFMRIQHAKKPQMSPKMQMLHSIYLYLRTLEETTHSYQPSGVGEDCSSPITAWRRLGSGSWDPGPTSSSWRNWSPSRGAEHESAMTSHDPKLVQNDDNNASIFEQIYSIPESLFCLMSHAASLAHAMSQVRGMREDDYVAHTTFSQQIRQTEADICSWKNVYQLPQASKQSSKFHSEICSGSPPQTNHAENAEDISDFKSQRSTLLHHFNEALHAAIIIYFYRTVKDVNTVTLQPIVERALYHLLKHETLKEKYHDPSSNTCWPGFIAGCEALDPKHQDQISGWLQRSAQQSGMRMFEVADMAVKQVWKARATSGNFGLHWSEVLKQDTSFSVLVLS